MRAGTVLFAGLIALFSTTISVEGWFLGRAKSYVKDFYGGSKDMWNNYNDMKDANTIGADKYFHAKGNYEAANRGAGGKHAATLISNAREGAQLLKGGVKSIFDDKTKWSDVWSDYKADQEANKWGRNGGDPNKYRPNGLDDKYRK